MDYEVEKQMLDKMKESRTAVQTDIAVEEANEYAKEIAADVAAAEKSIRAKYAEKKAAKIAELKNVQSGLEYLIDVTARALAEKTVAEEEKIT